jgi:hypothetical protein
MEKTRNPNYPLYIKLFYEQDIYSDLKSQADEELDTFGAKFLDIYQHFEEIGQALQ